MAEVPRPGLSIDVIIETACELIAEAGTEALTMRRLSERLGVALGATYHYVPNRDGLLLLVAERINNTIAIRTTDPKQWQYALKSLMIDFATAFARYPGMANFHLANVMATGPADTRDRILEMLHKAGFETESAFTLLAALFFYTSGVSSTELLSHDQPGLPASMVALRFEQGIDMLLDGAAVQLRADKKTRRAGA
ncbi:MAG: TetR family transcriptional regulator [Actinomycetota bacterium]|nr:TetR family transcriptional regulator [Actinomycetota bacterium]